MLRAGQRDRGSLYRTEQLLSLLLHMEGREVRTDLNPIHSDPGHDCEVLAPPEGPGQVLSERPPPLRCYDREVSEHIGTYSKYTLLSAYCVLGLRKHYRKIQGTSRSFM